MYRLRWIYASIYFLKKKYLDRFSSKLKKSIPLISFVLIITPKGVFIINYIYIFFFIFCVCMTMFIILD